MSTANFSGWVKAQKALRRLASQRVEVGVLGPGRNAEVAFFAEYGTASIPARGFLSRPLAENRRKYVDRLGKAAHRAARGETTDDQLELLGLLAVADIRKWVTGGHATPKNSPATVARKGSSTPLVDTGELLQSLQHRVVTGGRK